MNTGLHSTTTPATNSISLLPSPAPKIDNSAILAVVFMRLIAILLLEVDGWPALEKG
jgi:hypothetical protein